MDDAVPGTIILLNGTGSSGKTSIAKAIQQAFDAPYLLVGIDLFWERIFPWEWAAAHHEGVVLTPIADTAPAKCVWDVQPFGHLLISGLHHTVATLSRLGHNLVVDHALDHPQWLTECLDLWQGLPVWFVGVRCPLEIVRQRAGARTTERFKEYVDVVTWEFDETHKHTRGIYDLEVDTSRLTPTECALQIKRLLCEDGSPCACNQLATLLASP